MKKHAMDCFVWAAQKAIATKDDEESQSRSDNSATEDESPAAKGCSTGRGEGRDKIVVLTSTLDQTSTS